MFHRMQLRLLGRVGLWQHALMVYIELGLMQKMGLDGSILLLDRSLSSLAQRGRERSLSPGLFRKLLIFQQLNKKRLLQNDTNYS
jgi:hypothetical protein